MKPEYIAVGTSCSQMVGAFLLVNQLPFGIYFDSGKAITGSSEVYGADVTAGVVAHGDAVERADAEVFAMKIERPGARYYLVRDQKILIGCIASA